MSYTKYTWVTGEVITADKLNHMEDGIEAAGKVFEIEKEDDEYIVKATPSELYPGAVAVYDGTQKIAFICMSMFVFPGTDEHSAIFLRTQGEEVSVFEYVYSEEKGGYAEPGGDEPVG